MISRAIVALVVVLPFSLSTADAAGAAAIPAAEYSQHFDALGKLSLAVAGTMPIEQYAFRPHPESMSFGALMSHIANPNYAFCAGLKDTDPPAMPSPADTNKDAVLKFLSNSFDYCSTVIPTGGATQQVSRLS